MAGPGAAPSRRKAVGGDIALQRGRRRKLSSIYAPMLAAGVGSFLAPTQKSRTSNLEMVPYTEETKPEREYDDHDVEDLDAVYSFLRHWAAGVKLDPKPPMPPGVLRRSADNARALLSIADSCGPEWGLRARKAVTFLCEKEKAERPEITMIWHGLVIFETLELDQIKSTQFNRELLRLDLPDARWTRYRGPSGTDYAHPIEMHEQAALLGRIGIPSETCWPPGPRRPRTSFRGYKRAAFEAAARRYGVTAPDDAEPGCGRLPLITPRSD